jgi:lysophospholipase L1-like esterase
MRKQLVILSLILVSVFSFGQNKIYDTIRYAKAHYQMRMAVFNGERIQKGRIIFLGNSITEFGDWQKLLDDSTVINRGIAGDNTFGVLDRLEEVIRRAPSQLYIKIGINDISQGIPPSVILQNVVTIIKRVKAGSPETKIYMHSILPTNDNVKNEYPDAFNKNELVDQVNEKIKQKAATLSFTYIDLNKELRDKNGELDMKYADPDGLHLNETGYNVWIRYLKANGYFIKTGQAKY